MKMQQERRPKIAFAEVNDYQKAASGAGRISFRPRQP
jgi:hypothetical protein